MKVVTDLQLSDIVAINARNYFANRARYVMCLIVAVAYGFYLVNDVGMPADQRGWIILAAGAGIFAVACFFLFLGVGILNAVSMVKNHRGAVGRHEVQILPEGFRDTTEFSDSLIKWPAIAQIVQRGDYLSFWVSPYLAHVVPKRAFADAEAFAAFERRARAYHAGDSVTEAAAPPPQPLRLETNPALWKRPA